MKDKIDNEYIRDGVKLAEGCSENSWSFRLTQLPEVYPERAIFAATDDPPRWFIDALVAQLISQVDETGYTVRVSKDETVIYNMGVLYASHAGEGRAMNSLKAILDSRVLVMDT